MLVQPACRFMFLVQRRGGSQLLNRLLGQVDDSQTVTDKKEVYITPQPLCVKEECLYFPLYSQVPEILDGLKPEYPIADGKKYAFLLYAEACEYDPVEDECCSPIPAWGTTKLQTWLPHPLWKVYSMIRDGREHVVSLLRGEWQSARKIKDHEDFDFLEDYDLFIKLCKHWKSKARLNLDSQKDHPHFKIVKFEDMQQNPQEWIATILRECSLTPDLKSINLNIHTSSTWTREWGTDRDILDWKVRYECLFQKHWDIMMPILMPELAELGYRGRGIDE